MMKKTYHIKNIDISTTPWYRPNFEMPTEKDVDVLRRKLFLYSDISFEDKYINQ